MKISVITVCYNAAATLEETIQSVLSQTHPNIEYIIVDGASTDQTPQILAKYKDQLAVCISEPDRGIYDAMNKGLDAATGDIIAILNSDDLFKDPKVLFKVEHWFKELHCDALSTEVEIFTKNPSNVIRHYSSTRWKPWMFRIGWQPPHPGFFVKREVYKKFGKFDTQFRIAADFDLMLRLILKYKIKVAYIPYTSVSMRAGGESQRSFKNIAKTNREDHLALKKNGFFSWYPLIWLKYPLKIFQFIK